METWYYYFIMTLRTLTLNWLACFPASNLSFLLLLSPFHYRKKFICYCTFIKGHSYSRKISKSGSLWYCDCAQTNFEKCAMVYSQNSLWKLHARSCSKLLTNMVSTFSKFVFFLQNLGKSPLVSKCLSTKKKTLPFSAWFQGQKYKVCRSFKQRNWFGQSSRSSHGQNRVIYYHTYLQPFRDCLWSRHKYKIKSTETEAIF